MVQKKKQITKEEYAEMAWQLNVDSAKRQAENILSGETYHELENEFQNAVVSIRQFLWGIQRVWGTVMTLQHYDDPLNGSKVFAKHMENIAKFTELAALLSEKAKACEYELCSEDNGIRINCEMDSLCKLGTNIIENCTIENHAAKLEETEKTKMDSLCKLGKNIIENCTPKPKETEENKK